MAGFCEDVTEPSGSLENKEFLDSLINYQISE
jgi:hypothetical protein